MQSRLHLLSLYPITTKITGHLVRIIIWQLLDPPRAICFLDRILHIHNTRRFKPSILLVYFIASIYTREQDLPFKQHKQALCLPLLLLLGHGLRLHMLLFIESLARNRVHRNAVVDAAGSIRLDNLVRHGYVVGE